MTTGILKVAATGARAWVLVEGKGSFQNAGLLKDAGARLIAGGAGRLCIGLAECTGMDSTFLGILAGLAMKLRGTGGALHLAGLSGRNLELVENMGLDRLATIEPTAPAAPAALSTVEGGAASKAEASGTMLEAHENLIELDPRNRDKFQDVVEYLRKSASRNE